MAVSWQKPTDSPLAFPKAAKVKTRAKLKQTGGPRKRRPGPPRKSERVYDSGRIEWVKANVKCAVWELGLIEDDCEGPIEYDHMGKRPLGRKCSDDQGCSLCMKHHRERTDFSGLFKYWTGLEMRAFLDAAIALANERFNEAHR